MAKYCAKCGKPQPDNEEVFRDSGAPQTESEAALFTRMSTDTEVWKTREPVKKRKVRVGLSPGSRRTRAFYAGALLVAALAAVLILLSQPAPRVIRALRDGEIDRALEIFWSSSALAEGEANPKVDAAVLAAAEDVCDRFAARTVDADTAAELLGKLGTFGADAAEKLETVYARFRSFNDSQDHMTAAEQLFAEGSFLEARDEYLKIIEGDSHFDKAQTQAALCVTRYGEHIGEAAEAAMAENDYGTALALLREGDDLLYARDTFSEVIDSKLQDCIGRYRTYLLSETERLAAEEDYPAAVSLLEEALPAFKGEEPKLTEALELYRRLERDRQVTEAGKRAEALYADGQYAEAFAELDAARAAAEDSADAADALIAGMERRFAQEMCDAAEEIFDGKRENLEAAIDLLENAVATRGLEPMLVLRDELSQYLPLSLVETEFSAKEGNVFRNSGTFESMDGTKYKKGWLWGEDGAEISFALDGSYDLFTCTFAMRRDDKAAVNGHFEVYCDGEQVYKSATLYHFRKDELEVSVEISGCRELKLVFVCDYEVSTTENGYCYHGICDPMLTKKLDTEE